MKKDGFEYVKLDEVDLNELALYNGRLFFKVGEEVYAEDYVLDIVLHYDNETKTWVDVSSSRPKEGTSDYDFNLALFRFKDNPPWPYFDKVLKKRAVENKKYYETLKARNTKKVIGWIASDDMNEYSQDDSEEGFLAVVNDIIEHGWACTGMEFDNKWIYALLNTHQYVSLGTRSWGAAMAAAHGNYGQMDYCEYAFGFSDEVFDDEPFYPKIGMYIEEKIKTSIISTDAVLEEIAKHETEECLKKFNVYNIYYLLPDFYEEGKYYKNPGDIEVVTQTKKDKFFIDRIEYFYEPEQFDNFINELIEENKDETLYLFDSRAIHEMLKKGPIYLLFSMIM